MTEPTQHAESVAVSEDDLRTLIGWATLIAGKPKNVNAAVDRLTDALTDGTGCGPAGSTAPADPHDGVDSA